MLPAKRKLRECLAPYREPPKAVLSFFKGEHEEEYAAVGKVVTAEGKRIYTLLYYSETKLERASFISRSFNSLDVIPYTPVKWYRRNLFADDKEKVMLIDAGPFYSYFKHKNRNTSPFIYLSNLISDKKEADALKKFVEGVHRKNAAYNAEMRPVLRRFQEYARNVQSYGVFNTEDRHFGNCLECGQDFHTDEVLKYKCRQVCPHCGRYLTMFTYRTVPRFSVEYGVQYIDRDVNQELVVRHFLVTKYFKPNGSEVSYFEYERDRFKKNSFGYSFYYQVSRWNSRADTMLWRDSKPYQGYMWSMRNIFYEDEYLYTDNLETVFRDLPEYTSTLKLLVENKKVRAEEYLYKMDKAFEVAKDFIVKGYPELLYNYYPNELAGKSVEESLRGINEDYRRLIKQAGFVTNETLERLRQIQQVSFDTFLYYYRHAKGSGLNRINRVISVLRFGPVISEKLIKASYSCLWNNMSETELQQYDDCSIKELFKSLTPSYKQFIRKRSSVTIQEIELLRRQCVKGVSITDFNEKVASIKKHISFSSRASTVEIWSDFLEKCEKYNVSVHKALHYLEDNDYYCWNDMCKWYLMLFGKPKRNALLVKSMMTMHDNLYALIQEKRDKESRQKAAIINSLIGRICRFFTNQHLQYYALSDGLVAVIPQSKEDFIREGNDMHICVGGFDYSMRHAKKNSVIFFLRQSDAVDSSYCCCEARVSNGKIVLAQCRMEHNQQPENAVRKAAEDYCRVLNKTIQFKENALLLKAA